MQSIALEPKRKMARTKNSKKRAAVGGKKAPKSTADRRWDDLGEKSDEGMRPESVYAAEEPVTESRGTPPEMASLGEWFVRQTSPQETMEELGQTASVEEPALTELESWPVETSTEPGGWQGDVAGEAMAATEKGEQSAQPDTGDATEQRQNPLRQRVIWDLADKTDVPILVDADELAERNAAIFNRDVLPKSGSCRAAVMERTGRLDYCQSLVDSLRKVPSSEHSDRLAVLEVLLLHAVRLPVSAAQQLALEVKEADGVVLCVAVQFAIARGDLFALAMEPKWPQSPSCFLVFWRVAVSFELGLQTEEEGAELDGIFLRIGQYVRGARGTQNAAKWKWLMRELQEFKATVRRRRQVVKGVGARKDAGGNPEPVAPTKPL